MMKLNICVIECNRIIAYDCKLCYNIVDMDKKTEQKNVTGKDIAELAGVSQSTVSRVLSSTGDDSLISEKTAARIRAIAKEVGYSPNPIARALRGEKTYLIGLIVREIADPFFAGIIEELIGGFRQFGYSVILGHGHSDPTEALEITRVLDSRQCDGMIFLGDLNDDMKYIKSIIEQDHPAVTMCRGNQPDPIPSVNCNNASGTRMLIDHLLELGHKKIDFIDGGSIGDIRERRTAFSQLEEQYSNLFNTIITAERNNFEGGYKAAKTLLEKEDLPTAIMAADDGMAVGVLSALKDAGFDVPGQISVTGFDDIELSKYLVPGLTTIRQPIEEMSKAVIDMLLKLINKQSLTEAEMNVILEPKLIVRDSSGPVSGK